MTRGNIEFPHDSGPVERTVRQTNGMSVNACLSLSRRLLIKALRTPHQATIVSTVSCWSQHRTAPRRTHPGMLEPTISVRSCAPEPAQPRGQPRDTCHCTFSASSRQQTASQQPPQPGSSAPNSHRRAAHRGDSDVSGPSGSGLSHTMVSGATRSNRRMTLWPVWQACRSARSSRDSLLHVLQENIGQSNAGDAFYRYKRPKLVARVRLRWPPLVLCA